MDRRGDKIGKIAAVYVEEVTNQTAWVLVHTGVFGIRERIVPIVHAVRHGDDVSVPFEKAFVLDAPSVNAEIGLTEGEAALLGTFYRLVDSDAASDGDAPVMRGRAKRCEPPLRISLPETSVRLLEPYCKSRKEVMTKLDYDAWIGHQAIDIDGQKIGKIAALYNDDQTGQPEWVTITTGLFGSKETFAPIAGARAAGDDLQLAYSKDEVKGAPKVDPDGHLEPSEEGELYRYYGLEDEAAPAQTEARDDAMTRSEEELSIAKQKKEAGRVRLVKRVVTEDVNVTVPVQHEEMRLEREDITDANRAKAMDGAEISEGEHEMVLNAEEVVVSKRVVPQERVRLAKDTVTEDKKVSETVRKEQIDIDADKPVKQ